MLRNFPLQESLRSDNVWDFLDRFEVLPIVFYICLRGALQVYEEYFRDEALKDSTG